MSCLAYQFAHEQIRRDDGVHGQPGGQLAEDSGIGLIGSAFTSASA